MRYAPYTYALPSMPQVQTTVYPSAELAGEAASKADGVLFVNLSNGVEALPWLGESRRDVRYMRLQSSMFELKRFEMAAASLPDELLLRLALGERCVILDAGAKRPVPRAVYQGVAIAAQQLAHMWLDSYDARRDGMWTWTRSMTPVQLTDSFVRSRVLSMPDAAKRRLAHYKKYADAAHLTDICIDCITWASNDDGDYATHCMQVVDFEEEATDVRVI